MKIISVHVPKAGGTSIANALSRALGSAFRTDYADDPANPLSLRNLDPVSYFARRRVLEEGTCLHGHFHPGQFQLGDVFLFTLLRHPVENIISIYFFWRSLPTQGQPLHDYFLSSNLGILEMAKLPLLRYLYSKTYFGSFDMSRFDLIGRHENRGRILEDFSRATGVSLRTSVHVNPTPPNPERDELKADARKMAHLHDVLADDIRFYERFTASR